MGAKAIDEKKPESRIDRGIKKSRKITIVLQKYYCPEQSNKYKLLVRELTIWERFEKFLIQSLRVKKVRNKIRKIWMEY